MYHSSIEEIKGMRVTLFWKSPTGYAIATSFKNTRALKKRNLLKHLIGAVLYSWSTTFWHGTLQFIHKMSGHGHGHGHGCSCEHEHDPAERGLEYGLYQRIDLEKLQCLNESRDGDGKLVFKPWDQRREREKVTAARRLCCPEQRSFPKPQGCKPTQVQPCAFRAATRVTKSKI